MKMKFRTTSMALPRYAFWKGFRTNTKLNSLRLIGSTDLEERANLLEKDLNENPVTRAEIRRYARTTAKIAQLRNVRI